MGLRSLQETLAFLRSLTLPALGAVGMGKTWARQGAIWKSRMLSFIYRESLQSIGLASQWRHPETFESPFWRHWLQLFISRCLGWSYGSLGACLCSVCEAMGLIPTTAEEVYKEWSTLSHTELAKFLMKRKTKRLFKHPLPGYGTDGNCSSVTSIKRSVMFQ